MFLQEIVLHKIKHGFQLEEYEATMSIHNGLFGRPNSAVLEELPQREEFGRDRNVVEGCFFLAELLQDGVVLGVRG